MAKPWERFLSKQATSIESTLKRVGKEAPYISKTSFRLPSNFHGIQAIHIGEDIPKAQLEHLDQAVSNMAELYPGAHGRIDKILLRNQRKMSGQISVPNWETFPWGHAAGAASAVIDESGQPVTRIGLNNTLINYHRKYSGLMMNATHISNYYGEMDDTALGRTWAHEFGHARQYHYAMNNIIPNLTPDGENLESVWPAALERVSRDFNTPIHGATSNQLIFQGMLSDIATAKKLGSAYAGSQPIELFPEVSVMRHYGHPLYTPQLEEAMQAIDRITGSPNRTIRQGARPHSKAAMGGIAYLQ